MPPKPPKSQVKPRVAERREDPADGQLLTFAEFVGKYKDQYSEPEIVFYWDSQARSEDTLGDGSVPADTPFAKWESGAEQREDRPLVGVDEDQSDALIRVEELEAEVRLVNLKLQQACREREEYRRRAETAVMSSAERSAGSMKPPSSFAIAACDFQLSATQATPPGDGLSIDVTKGDSLEVVGRHVAGWVRVKHTARFDNVPSGDEGWIPESVLEAVGEVGRGIATQNLTPRDDSDGELAITRGVLLKLLGREGEWWLAEVDGCRGFVPVAAVRQPQPDEVSGVPALTTRLRRALTRLPAMPAEEDGGGHESNRPRAGSGQRRSRSGSDAKAAQAKRLAADGREGTSPWTFGLWAYVASFYTLTLCILLGVVGILWFVRSESSYPEDLQDYMGSWRNLGAAVYSLIGGFVWLAFQLKSKLAMSSHRTPRGMPVRAAVFAALAIPLCCAGVTSLAGICVLTVAVISFFSAYYREAGAAPDATAPLRVFKQNVEEEFKGVSRCSCRYWRIWWELQGVRGERPKWIVIILWVAANVWLGLYKYYVTRQKLLYPSDELVNSVVTKCWTGNVEAANDNCLALLDAYQTWVPIAKFNGQCLNLNCALLMLPVCQHFLKKLSTSAIKNRRWLGALCRWLPIHKNLIFHKALAATIALQATAHTVAHYLAHSYTLTIFDRYGVTGAAVTLSIWATGATIMLCIVVMYPVSRDYVKKTHFEAFFYTHIIGATIFMMCLLWHAPVFYLWAAFPICLYLIDRYFRSEVVSLTGARLLQVRWRPPVLQLVFASPWQYASGQYVWLRCPTIAKYELHPFTIASAPETGTLALAIKCWPGGWTEKLRDLLAVVIDTGQGSSAAGAKSFAHTFEEVDWLTNEPRRGITSLADGSPLLQIDGPHCAPAMRYLEFEVVILAAAGIGLTPASSILRSLLQHRWRTDSHAKPQSLYFAWLCSCTEVPAFEWFADEMSDSEVAAAAAMALHPDECPARHLELHLFVTRAPAATEEGARGPPKARRADLYGFSAGSMPSVSRPYTGVELLHWMQHPNTKSDRMADILQLPHQERPNAAGCTLLWNGRPNWDGLFAHVSGRHQSAAGQPLRVGVFFCGAPAIGKDLKQCCHNYSNRHVNFFLLKENF